MTPPKIALVTLAWTALVGAVAWTVGPVSVNHHAVEACVRTSVVLAVAGAFLAATGRTAQKSEGCTLPRTWRYLTGVGDATTAIGVIVAILTAAQVSTTVVTPWTGPAADAWLSAPERLLGVTQADAVRVVEELGARRMLSGVYGSLEVQLMVGCLWWLAVGRSRPLWSAGAALGVCVAVGIPAYLLMPAHGPAHEYGLAAHRFYADWLTMRSGVPCTVDLQGYVAAPSFHIVFSALLTRLFWRTPMRLGAILLNGLLMPPATWVIGGHYLTDLVLGAALFLAAVVLVDGRPSFARVPVRVTAEVR